MLQLRGKQRTDKRVPAVHACIRGLPQLTSLLLLCQNPGTGRRLELCMYQPLMLPSWDVPLYVCR